MAQAELRFDSLRMRIVDRQVTSHGEESVTHEVWLRHPGFAKIVSTRGDASDGDYDVWVSDTGDRAHVQCAGADRDAAPRPAATGRG